MAKLKRMYAEITKAEKQDDGTIKVYGYASSGSKDFDGEVITAKAMKAALPDYMKWGAVREMHQASAVGTALEASVEDDGRTWFGAHVVDPIAVLKVETGVYKGFSVGGKVTQRDKLNKTIIEGINLVEVSLVDRPANPDACITLFKAARTEADDVEDLANLLDAGEVTPAQVLELIKAAKGTPQGESVAAPSADGTPSSANDGSIAGSTEETAEKTASPSADAGGDTVQKGMYTLKEFAGLLEQIGWLARDTQGEADFEMDSSPVPAQLREWLKAGLAIFNTMAVEEVQEFTAQLGKATTGLDVAKAGKRFSTITKAALAKVHAACKEASVHLDALKYAEDDAEEAEGEEEAAKVAGAPASDTDGIVQKAVSQATESLNETLAKVNKENTDLKARVEDLGKRAAPGKALLKAVGKSQDITEDTPSTEDTPPPEGTPERAMYEMRKVHGGTGRRLF